MTTCVWCDKPLTVRKPGRRFCSDTHRQRYHAACMRLGAALHEQGFIPIETLRSTYGGQSPLAASAAPSTRASEGEQH